MINCLGVCVYIILNPNMDTLSKHTILSNKRTVCSCQYHFFIVPTPDFNKRKNSRLVKAQRLDRLSFVILVCRPLKQIVVGVVGHVEPLRGGSRTISGSNMDVHARNLDTFMC